MYTVSCVVCVYNEGPRLKTILDLVENHPRLSEVIVVDDGSTDETLSVLRGRRGVRVISYAPNRGKTHALWRGVSAARGDHLLLLDADLSGLTARDIDRLLDPVLAGRAEVSLSLRGNSLGLYRLIGLDFVTGERVLPSWLVREAMDAMAGLPRWGAEVFFNALVIRHGLSLAVVDWPGVVNVRKYRKVGRLRGLAAEFGMIKDALSVLSPIGVVAQHIGLLNLAHGRRRQPLIARSAALRRSAA